MEKLNEINRQSIRPTWFKKTFKLANKAINIRHTNLLVKGITDDDNITCIEDETQVS